MMSAPTESSSPAIIADAHAFVQLVLRLPSYRRVAELTEILAEAGNSSELTSFIEAIMAEAEHRQVKARRRLKRRACRLERREITLVGRGKKRRNRNKKLAVEALRLQDQMNLAYCLQ